MRRVKGSCPMGCGQHLRLDESGNVLCAMPGCPNSTAVATILDDPHVCDHLLSLRPESCSVMHPLAERIGGPGPMLDCPLHSWVQHLRLDQQPPGVYVATRQSGTRNGWRLVPLP